MLYRPCTASLWTISDQVCSTFHSLTENLGRHELNEAPYSNPLTSLSLVRLIRSEPPLGRTTAGVLAPPVKIQGRAQAAPREVDASGPKTRS